MLSVDDRGPPPPLPTLWNLVSDVLAGAEATPDRIALSVIGPTRAERWSFARLAETALGLAAHLAAAGLPPGARILLRLGNTPEFPVAYLGAIAAGFVPVIVSSQWTEPEVASAIALTTPALAIRAPSLPMPDTPLPELAASDIATVARRAPLPPVSGGPDRPAHIVFTSGTTSTPRAVVHAHRALRARRMMWRGWYGLTPDDRVFHAGAFNWTFTLGTGLLDPWAAGAAALVPAPGVTPAQIPLLLRRHQATIFAAAPGVFRRLLASGNVGPIPGLRHALSAGEKLPDTLRDGWEAATGTPIHEAFGMSECSTFLSGSPIRSAPPGTIGFAQPGRRIAILGEDGAPVPRGTPGHIAVSGDDPGLMLGYLGPEGPRLPLRNGWFVTGDLAEMGEDGAIRYLGRGDDMMNAGGHRVSPVEVEEALSLHPAVTECAAAEIAVKADTTVIAAFVVSPAPLDEAALAAHMAERLARYKCPRLFLRVDALPRNVNGKLLRRTLAAAHNGAHDPA